MTSNADTLPQANEMEKNQEELLCLLVEQGLTLRQVATVFHWFTRHCRRGQGTISTDQITL
jgi:hypothetical protein